jgi:hypothetical protein
VLRLSPHLLGVFLLEGGEGFALWGSQQLVERRGLSVCEGVGLESGLHVRGGVCEARCTNVNYQGYRGLLCGGGEVLQPVEFEGVALLDPQVRQSVRYGARDYVVAFFALERVTPNGLLVIRRVRVFGMQKVSAGAACCP